MARRKFVAGNWKLHVAPEVQFAYPLAVLVGVRVGFRR